MTVELILAQGSLLFAVRLIVWILTETRLAEHILASIALMIRCLLSRPGTNHITMLLLLYVLEITLQHCSPLKLGFCFSQYLFLLFAALGKWLIRHRRVAGDLHCARLSDGVSILFLICAVSTYHVVSQQNLTLPVLCRSSA